jgi:hypothetical protein
MQAGIIPAITKPSIATKLGFPFLPGTRHVIFTPGQKPFYSLASAVVNKEETPQLYRADYTQLAQILCEAAGDASTIQPVLEVRLLSPAPSDAPSSAEFLIVVDQTEELWTRCNADDRTRFLRLLATAARPERVRVLVTLRGDLFDKFECFGLRNVP